MIDISNYLWNFGTVYFSPKDETADYLQLINMALDAAIEVSQNCDDEDLFSEDSSQIALAYKKITQNSMNSLDFLGEDVEHSRITSIVDNFRLDTFGMVCMLLGAAPSFDEGVQEKFKKLRNDHNDHYLPTFALAKKVYALFSEGGSLGSLQNEHNMIEACPLFRVKTYGKSAIRDNDSIAVSRQLIAVLKGEDDIPENQCPYCLTVDAEGKMLSGRIVKRSIRNLLDSDTDLNVINICGPKGSGRKFIVRKALDDEQVIFVDTERLASLDSEGIRNGIREILVRAGIFETEIVLTDLKVTQTNAALQKSIVTEIVRLHGRVFVTSLADEPVRGISEDLRYHAIRVEKPKATERLNLWKKAAGRFGDVPEDVLKEAALLYDITPGMIENGVRSAWAFAIEDGRENVELSDIKRAILSFNSSKLSSLATPLNGKYRFDDLRIADGQKRLLRLACSRIRNKGLVEDEWGLNRDQTYGHGVSILLYGPPGTGKTMAATVIANEVGRALYRVDLSQMIDKYVGETEKNLGKVFDAARDGNFVLFFDEADSLFAKRTEVNSSNDKHANNEVSYLLQKMEEYDGLSIMATNRFNNFDNAFLRRITYIVNLDKPDAETRLVMYKNILNDKIPVDPKLDVEFFAKEFEISGSLIRSMITNAAYMAASENVPINNKHFVNAMFLEEKKDGRKLGFEDFKQYGVLLDIRM